jgi:dTDP-4-amino-4,6-dideoxygalactose transaminase
MVKTKKKISLYSWPKYSAEEIKIVKKIMSSGKVNYWTGNECTNFENNFKKKFKLNYAISVANGSVALDAAINSLSLKKGDEVLVTSRSYVSTASCVQSTKAKIKFLDIDLKNQNILFSDLISKINKNTKVIICTHLAGWPCDINKIKKIINNKNIIIIEDCSQAHGAKINGEFVGSMGDLSVWSFCNDKIISTLGEGGMVGCKSFKLWKKIWAYKDCGKNYLKIHSNSNSKNKLFKWVHDDEGTNLRLTEIQAAVGNYQLKKLDMMVNRRNANCKFLWKNIKKNKYIFSPTVPKNIKHAGYRCYLYAINKLIRDKFLDYLNENGIDANQGSCPEIYKEKRFSNHEKYKVLQNAKKLGEISVSLPSHHLLKKNDLIYMVNKINKFLNKI